MESLGEVRKFSQMMFGKPKVSEGGVNLNPKVIVLQGVLGIY